MNAAQAMYQHLCRAHKARFPLSSLVVLYWLAANPGEHDRASIHRAVFTHSNTRQFDWMVGRLIKMGLVSHRLVSGNKTGLKYVHGITPEGLKWLRIKEEVAA